VPQAPSGPTGRRDQDGIDPAPACGSARRRKVCDMATITKVRKKLERSSALRGWRMRWYMQ